MHLTEVTHPAHCHVPLPTLRDLRQHPTYTIAMTVCAYLLQDVLAVNNTCASSWNARRTFNTIQDIISPILLHSMRHVMRHVSCSCERPFRPCNLECFKKCVHSQWDKRTSFGGTSEGGGGPHGSTSMPRTPSKCKVRSTARRAGTAARGASSSDTPGIGSRVPQSWRGWQGFAVCG